GGGAGDGGGGGGPAGGEGAVEGRELAEEDPERPAVGDDVVHRQEQQVVLPAQDGQGEAHERPAGEVEGGGEIGRGQAPRLPLAGLRREGGEVEARQRQRRRRLDHLHRLAIHDVEAGAQRLVPADDLGEAAGPHRRL